MKKLVVGLLMALVLVGGTVAPAGARGHDQITPRQFCLDVYETRTDEEGTLTAYWVPIFYPMFGNEVMDLPLTSLAGCVSTVARGLQDLRQHGYVASRHLSMPAAREQCRYLEEEFGLTYPYLFYGQYPAENRADCARILLGLHTGELAPPPQHPEEPPIEQ
jgi:hypothetical protein